MTGDLLFGRAVPVVPGDAPLCGVRSFVGFDRQPTAATRGARDDSQTVRGLARFLFGNLAVPDPAVALLVTRATGRDREMKEPGNVVDAAVAVIP